MSESFKLWSLVNFPRVWKELKKVPRCSLLFFSGYKNFWVLINCDFCTPTDIVSAVKKYFFLILSSLFWKPNCFAVVHRSPRFERAGEKITFSPIVLPEHCVYVALGYNLGVPTVSWVVTRLISKTTKLQVYSGNLSAFQFRRQTLKEV